MLSIINNIANVKYWFITQNTFRTMSEHSPWLILKFIIVK